MGRFRRARWTERQQLRWLSFAAALAPAAVLVMYAGILTEHLEVAGWAVGVFLALLPLAIRWPSNITGPIAMDDVLDQR